MKIFFACLCRLPASASGYPALYLQQSLWSHWSCSALTLESLEQNPSLQMDVTFLIYVFRSQRFENALKAQFYMWLSGGSNQTSNLCLPARFAIVCSRCFLFPLVAGSFPLAVGSGWTACSSWVQIYCLALSVPALSITASRTAAHNWI